MAKIIIEGKEVEIDDSELKKVEETYTAIIKALITKIDYTKTSPEQIQKEIDNHNIRIEKITSSRTDIILSAITQLLLETLNKLNEKSRNESLEGIKYVLENYKTIQLKN